MIEYLMRKIELEEEEIKKIEISEKYANNEAYRDEEIAYHRGQIVAYGEALEEAKRIKKCINAYL